MKGMVEGNIYRGNAKETIEEHMARCHPDLKATQLERIELMKKLTEKFNAKQQE